MIFCWPDMMDDIFQQTKQCFDTTAETLLTFFRGTTATDQLMTGLEQLETSSRVPENTAIAS